MIRTKLGPLLFSNIAVMDVFRAQSYGGEEIFSDPSPHGALAAIFRHQSDGIWGFPFRHRDTPQSSISNDGIFHYKPTILGYLHFRKPPYIHGIFPWKKPSSYRCSPMEAPIWEMGISWTRSPSSSSSPKKGESFLLRVWGFCLGATARSLQKNDSVNETSGNSPQLS